MPLGLLAILIILVWNLWVVASTTHKAVDDTQHGVRDGRHGGLRVLPAIPLFPMALWVLAWLIDRESPPWGTVIVSAGHALFGFVLLASIWRDWRYLDTPDLPERRMAREPLGSMGRRH